MPRDVQAELNYCIDDGERQYVYVRQRTDKERDASPHKTDFGGGQASCSLLIRDGRAANPALSLDDAGFELITHPTTLTTSDFYNDTPKVTSVYYREIATAMKAATGADHVVVFSHQIRNEARVDGKGGKVESYARGVHSDACPLTAEQIFRRMVERAKQEGDVTKDYSRGRFLYLNAWRSIGEHPIDDNALALCDERSLIKPDDYTMSDLYLEGCENRRNA